MPESAEEWSARVRAEVERGGYRPAEYAAWDTWPFDCATTPRALRPLEPEASRGGAGGVDCFICAKRDDPSYAVWRDDLWFLGRPHKASAMPVMVFLMPRRHADLADLTGAESARMGTLLAAAERAIIEVLDVPRIQVYRYGDGQEHLHWWLIGRPAGAAQLRGSFLPLWDDLLPPRPPADTEADLRLVADRLVALEGGVRVTEP